MKQISNRDAASTMALNNLDAHKLFNLKAYIR